MINKQLESLYSDYFEYAILKYNGEYKERHGKISNPLLIKVDEKKYNDSSLKVMIFGQETYGWNGEFGSENIENLMSDYLAYLSEDETYFNHDSDRYKFSSKRIKKKGSRAFWKGFKFFEQQISKDHAKSSNSNPYFIWNNIVKVGRANDKGISANIRNFERDNFPVISKEMEILRPDIVIFMTGKRDYDIKYNFEGTLFDSMGREKITSKTRKYSPPHKMKSKKLPERSVRLYHPSYYGGFNKIKKIALEMII